VGVPPDPFAPFAESYIAGKLADIDRALAELDARPDALEQSDTRRRLLELRAQLVAALTSLPPQSGDTPPA
jgi:hypothetical protein